MVVHRAIGISLYMRYLHGGRRSDAMEQTNRRCPTHGIPLARRYKTETTDTNKVRKVPEFFCRVCSINKALERHKVRAFQIERLKKGLAD